MQIPPPMEPGDRITRARSLTSNRHGAFTTFFEWDDAADPEGNVQHIAEHGVTPEEVEAVLKSHPGVFDVLVVGVPDERLGEQVVAVVQPRDGEEVVLDDLQSHARRDLAGYKVPRAVELVREITRTPAGKPDYRWARSLARERRGTR